MTALVKWESAASAAGEKGGRDSIANVMTDHARTEADMCCKLQTMWGPFEKVNFFFFQRFT